MEMQSKG
jgi:hypothetical protein